MKTLKVTVAVLLMSVSAAFAQKTDVNIEQSNIVWTGNKIGGSHTGEIQLKSGYLDVDANKIKGGEFVVDMMSITNTDLEDPGYNQKLVGHLRSDDFFGVEKYPTATFKITKAGAFKANKASVEGELTIKGKTESIAFEVEKKGKTYVATIEVDRSKFDVRYGSESFFDNLGDNLIYNIFTLEVELAL